MNSGVRSKATHASGSSNRSQRAHAVELLAKAASAARGRDRPRSAHERRIVPHVLAMAAAEQGGPVARLVARKTGDEPLHGSGPTIPPGGTSVAGHREMARRVGAAARVQPDQHPAHRQMSEGRSLMLASPRHRAGAARMLRNVVRPVGVFLPVGVERNNGERAAGGYCAPADGGAASGGNRPARGDGPLRPSDQRSSPGASPADWDGSSYRLSRGVVGIPDAAASITTGECRRAGPH